MSTRHRARRFGKTFMRRYAAWLRREERKGEPVARAIAALDFPPTTIETLERMHDGAVTVGVARTLTARAHALIAIHPKKSAALALLAARVADAANAPSELVVALDTARGEAWMRYGAALFELGRFPDAWSATDRAEVYFQLASPFPPAFRSETTLGLIQGKILYFLGDLEGGLLRVEQSANLLLSVFEERDKYVEALTLYNALLMHAGRYEEAARRWEEIGALARESGDKATLAHIVNNVGRCFLQLGHLSQAEACFQTAFELFEELGMKAELPDVRLNLAYALRQAGLYRAAVAKLEACRNEFKNLGMMFSAAEVCIRIVETQLLAGTTEDLFGTCHQAVMFFREAGLPEQAQKAADYLLEASRTNSLSLEAVRAVCSFLTRLREFPEEQFRLAM